MAYALKLDGTPARGVGGAGLSDGSLQRGEHVGGGDFVCGAAQKKLDAVLAGWWITTRCTRCGRTG